MTSGDQARELQRIIEGQLVTTLFQPIVDCQRRIVVGYEVLTRGPSDSPLHAAPALFQAGEQCGQVEALERVCLHQAGRTCLRNGMNQPVFVNVSPGLLLPENLSEQRLEDLLTAHGIRPTEVVIELSERYPVVDADALKTSLLSLKKRGFQIAIDDLGSGYSGLKLWHEIQPDYVKVDRHFISDIHKDLVKKEFVRSVVNLCERLGCKLIAEGVETEAELSLLRSMGINLIQGFLVGRPNPFPAAVLDAIGPAFERPRHERVINAGLLSQPIEPLSPNNTLGDAWRRLQTEPSIFALPVVDTGRPVGLLHKWRVMEVFSSTYGRALNEKKSVTTLMAHDALVVGRDESLEAVSQSLLEDDLYYLKQHFVVTENDLYLGLGSTRTLLKMMTRQRVDRARHANPLSQLPGNVMIQQESEWRLQHARPFSCVYFDINHFKPFNDVLGYSLGDELILSLAQHLTDAFCAPTDWVGHIGGDDFVVFSCSQHVVEICREVQARFEAEARSRYPANIRDARKVTAVDRDGELKEFPLISLSAGIVHVDNESELSISGLASISTEAKGKAKLKADRVHVTRLNQSGISENLAFANKLAGSA
ncbi:bifunctional diguanylate cyclase/phosphodiesterase [Marinobacter sp. BGYM27]|uniref:bifunctional diguanylate cyclase/phosphodiesterase n=1 Tax=Marinobacter sp. BGYM27 TaxID=2975597 RepID=UPI0021A6D7D0|nr:bifunctional diguanylate cyclase/phosphodiesterase [Marinobacter sp. BGYM27]MDG5500338.1 EAL and GGDEF domain-containing protein [Marinobacter sp. BGYM27]